MTPRNLFLSVLAGLFAWIVLPACLALAQATTPPPDKVDQLIKLLDDPSVKEWLAKQVQTTTPAQAVPAQSAAPAESAPLAGAEMQKSMTSSVLDQVKHHLQRIATAIPDLPRQFAQARSVTMRDLSDRGLFGVTLLIAFFIAAGFALSWVVYRLTRPFRLWLISLSKDTPQGRAKKIGARLLYSTMLIGAFAVGSAGAFMVFDWPPLLREIVLTYLVAAIIARAVRMYANATMVPSFMEVAHAEEVRAFPMTNASADHWSRWVPILATWFIFIAATFALLPGLGFTVDGMLTLAIATNTVLLVLILLAIWRRPRVPASEQEGSIGHTAVTWMLTAFFVSLLLFRLAGFYTLLWFAFAAFMLPLLVVLAHKAVYFVLRPGPEEAGRSMIPAVTIAVVDRGIRVILILGAALLLATVWGLDMSSMESQEHPTRTMILRGLLNAGIIAIAADFGWSIIKALIERKLGVDVVASDHNEEEVQVIDTQQARLRTLLPIIQNIMFAVILIMAILMMLSSIGIQIAPLIAGVGVVGVAVGFGAQTVVKDVISGVFYLLDDAFRVGEYISSGKYMGTVESFSLRSIKLRHHRGPLFTIPFGELGAVQNQSRDWVTDKFNITVGYDTDIEIARKTIKKVGLEVAEDPEFKPWVIEPIKMQGVQEFGDYGIVLRIKMTTKPGGAFGMKRKFYVRIRQVFKEKGIELPFPTVHVQGPSQPPVLPAGVAGPEIPPEIAAEPITPADVPQAIAPEIEAAVAQAHIARRKKKAAAAAAAAAE